MNISKMLFRVFHALLVSFFVARFIIHHPPVNSEEFFYYLMFGIFLAVLSLYFIVRCVIVDLKTEDRKEEK